MENFKDPQTVSYTLGGQSWEDVTGQEEDTCLEL